jgi:hypothetical protein
MARENFERQSQKRIPGENCQRFTELDVTRRPATAKRIVVHRGQIVVDQRIGVDHLDRAGRGNRRLGIATRGLARQQRQKWPQPLAPCQKAVGHRLAQPIRTLGTEPIDVVGEVPIDQEPLSRQRIFKECCFRHCHTLDAGVKKE